MSLKKQFGSSPYLSTVNFEALYTQYVDKVFHKCLSITKDEATAQDFTQDIFIKAFTQLESFENRARLSTWLFSIAHNYCIDQLRLKKRLPMEGLEYQDSEDFGDTNTSEAVEDQLQMLEKVFNRLPPEEAQLLRLKYEHNLSINQLGEYYQTSNSAVKMRLKRSREKLFSLYANLNRQ